MTEYIDVAASKGGYFIWHLYPKQQVYIDGRGIPYIDHYHEFNGIFNSALNFQRAIDRYKIEYFYWAGFPNATKQFITPGKWSLVYWDKFGALFLKNTSANQAVIQKHAYRYLSPLMSDNEIKKIYRQEQVEVEKEIARLINLDPTYQVFYAMRAYLAIIDKDFESAITDYNQALGLDPKFASAYFYRGIAYKGKKLYDLAAADYTKALELDHTNKLAYANRGYIYQMQGKYELAIADYSQAIELDPSDASAYFNRGIVYEKNNQHSEAVASYKSFLKYATPSDPNIEQIKKKITRLE